MAGTLCARTKRRTPVLQRGEDVFLEDPGAQEEVLTSRAASGRKVAQVTVRDGAPSEAQKLLELGGAGCAGSQALVFVNGKPEPPLVP